MITRINNDRMHFLFARMYDISRIFWLLVFVMLCAFGANIWSRVFDVCTHTHTLQLHHIGFIKFSDKRQQRPAREKIAFQAIDDNLFSALRN